MLAIRRRRKTGERWAGDQARWGFLVLFKASAFMCLLFTSLWLAGQEPTSIPTKSGTISSSSSDQHANQTEDLNAMLFLRRLAEDQKMLWTASFRVRRDT